MENEVPIKSIPANLEAERAVLGSLLIDPDAILKVANFLRAEDFYRERHGWLYDVMLTLHERREPLDFVTVVDELERREQLEEIGGPAYITDLIAGTPTSINVDYYARIVERTALLRRLISAAGQIAELAYDESQDVDEVIDRAETLVFGVSEARIHRDLVPIRAIMGNVVDRIDFLTRNRDTLMGVPTGFTNLDRLLGGLQKSDLIILAARPAMGKCVAADTLLIDPDTGDLHTIEQLVRRQQARLLTLDDQLRLRPGQASAFVNDGIKPVYQVTTATGREVKVTLSHPFLTLHGWRPLHDLHVGDRIGVPRCLPVFGSDETPDTTIIDLAHQTRTHVSSFVFRLTRPKLALFLNRLFARDGSIHLLKTGQPGISYSTVSKRLARQVQHLLLRFGILSKLRTRSIRYSGAPRPAYELRVLDAASIRRFCTEIGAFGKEQPVANVPARLARSTRHTNTDTVPLGAWGLIEAAKGDRPWRSVFPAVGLSPGANLHVGQRTLSRGRLQAIAAGLESSALAQLADSDVYWDRITAIDYLGEQQVYDLTVPDTHNFVADDVLVHNTSLAINVAQNAAKRYNARVAIFSLEMSNEQLAQRLLSMETGIDSHRLRLGQVHEDEWPILLEAANVLAGANIFIDDTPAASVTEIRTKCRRLYAEHGLDLVLIDYMQLMSGQGTGRNENRQQEISYISRSLKALARELNVPVIALSQLSRAVESRSDKRPMLSDLRESGCLAGDTPVYLPEQGVTVPICELEGKSGVKVLTLNTDTWKQEPAQVSAAFCTGVKPVFRLTTQLGRTVRATANHKFLTIDGWKRLDELALGNLIAVPRSLPGPSAVTIDDAKLALLGHLIGDGCMLPRHAIQYTTREPDLAETVAELAVKAFGSAISPIIKRERSWYQVYLRASMRLTHNVRNPIAEWLTELGIAGMTTRAMQASLGTEYCGTSLYKQNLGRSRAALLAQVVKSPELLRLANSDVYWDSVAEIVPDGVEPVYDLTVPGNHNFVAGNIVVHNSIEQDADVVLFIYRDDYYNEDSEQQNIADVIVAKHRHGSTGTVSLYFRKELTQFRDLEIQRTDLEY